MSQLSGIADISSECFGVVGLPLLGTRIGSCELFCWPCGHKRGGFVGLPSSECCSPVFSLKCIEISADFSVGSTQNCR